MKRISLALLAAVFGILALPLLPNVFYNLAGFLNLQDGASGPKWETALAMVAFALLAFGSLFFSYRLFRLVAASPDSAPE
jgi:hypothetical protein